LGLQEVAGTERQEQMGGGAARGRGGEREDERQKEQLP
jgi:hypothetical protein